MSIYGEVFTSLLRAGSGPISDAENQKLYDQADKAYGKIKEALEEALDSFKTIIAGHPGASSANIHTYFRGLHTVRDRLHETVMRVIAANQTSSGYVFKEVQDALRLMDYEIGTRMPQGFGFNRPDSIFDRTDPNDPLINTSPQVLADWAAHWTAAIRETCDAVNKSIESCERQTDHAKMIQQAEKIKEQAAKIEEQAATIKRYQDIGSGKRATGWQRYMDCGGGLDQFLGRDGVAAGIAMGMAAAGGEKGKKAASGPSVLEIVAAPYTLAALLGKI